MADVDAVQSASQSLAATQLAAVTQFIGQLQAFTNTNSVDIPAATIESHLIDVNAVNGAFAQLASLRPTWSPGVGVIPSTPAAAVLGAIDVPDFGNVDEFTAKQPDLATIAVPSVALPSAPVPNFTVGAPVIPTMPTPSIPQAPSFQAVAMPSPLGVQIPSFSYVTPVSDITAPTSTFTFNEQDYTSLLSDTLKMKLFTDMENGGYGIEVNDERLLWDRARERTGIEANAKVEETLRLAAGRGFPLPPGADLAMVAAAQQAALEKIASVDREIALKRADMYVENRKFTITAATQVESLFINYRSSMMERSLNAAKAVVEMGVAVFNARVAKFNADLDAYKAYASVFETKIRAEQLKVEIYKGQVDGARASVEVQRVMADIYRNQLEGVNALINVYRTQMEGVKIVTEIDRTRVENFRAQVETYTAQIQAKGAEFGLYESQVKGEVLKQSAFESQVRAYATRVAAYQAKTQALESKTKAQATYNTAQIQTFTTQLDKYKADLDNNLRAAALTFERYKADLGLYGVSAGNVIETIKMGVNVNDVNVRLAEKNTDRAIAEAERTTQALFKLMDWRLNAAKYGTDATTNIAVAALQQITGLTSLLKTS